MSDRTRLRGPMRGRGDGGVEWRHTIRDRVILVDDPGAAADWEAENNKTCVANIAIHNKSVLFHESIGFDKVNGNATYAALMHEFAEPIDISRFLPLDYIEVCAFIPDLTNVEKVRMKLGSGTPNIPFSASEYKNWDWADTEWSANQWFVGQQTLAVGVGSADDIDPEAITWMGFHVNFDNMTDVLADIVLDSVVIRSAI